MMKIIEDIEKGGDENVFLGQNYIKPLIQYTFVRRFVLSGGLLTRLSDVTCVLVEHRVGGVSPRWRRLLMAAGRQTLISCCFRADPLLYLSVRIYSGFLLRPAGTPL